MSIVLQSAGGGSVTISEPSTALNVTATMPPATGTVLVSGGQPAFSAIPSAAQTGLSSGLNVKILFQNEIFDTNSNFASSTFTPTVAGYYQINGNIQMITGASATSANFVMIWKNGTEYRRGVRALAMGAGQNWGLTVSDLVYMNGSTDYLEIYGFSNGGTWQTEATNSYFSGALVRAA